MFTVLIAAKEHIDAIQQKNALFFEPFLEKKELAFCIWDPEGQSLSEAVPGLLDAVGRQKQWRAVILNSDAEEILQTRNPFDTVDNTAVDRLSRPTAQPAAEQSWDDWEASWKEYYDTLTPLKETVFRQALECPLQKLGTWLCFRPADFVLEEVRDTQDYVEAALEEEEGEGEKPNLRLERLEREQYRRELRMKELLRREFTGGRSINIAYPSEVYCISERLTENGYFSPDTFWNLRSSNDYSAFTDRNMYFDKMRFLVYDLLPRTHRDHRSETIRFLYTVLVFATNPIPGSVLRARKLYRLESESDDTPLCTLISSYDRKLESTYEVISAEMERIRSEVPGDLTDKEAEALFCTSADITVPLDASCDPERLFVEQKYGLSADCPEDALLEWNAGFAEAEAELTHIVKQQGRSVKKSVDKLRLFSEVSEINVSRLTSFQLDDVRDQTDAAEDEMIESLPPEIHGISSYSEPVRQARDEMRQVLNRRMSRKTTLLLGLVCLLVNLICLLPMLWSNLNTNQSRAAAGTVILIFMALLAAVLVAALFFLRAAVIRAGKAFNQKMSAVYGDIQQTMQKFSRYLSAACNVRRGHAVQNFAANNIDAYTKRIRIRKKHQADIRMKRAVLKELYSDFLGDSRYHDETMIRSYDYDFDQQVEYAYPAPFLAGDFCQIEFLVSGNHITVPSSYITGISARLEEIYER